MIHSSNSETKLQKIKRFIRDYWVGFLLLASFGTFLFATFNFKILDSITGSFFYYVSLPLFVVGFYWAFKWVIKLQEDGNSISILVIQATIALIFFTLLATFFLLGLFQIANGFWDNSEAKKYVVSVERGGCEEMDCTVNFKSWNLPEKRVSLSIPTSIYNKIRHPNELQITTKAGSFGFEWIVDVKNVK
jgi:hypothetical protein